MLLPDQPPSRCLLLFHYPSHHWQQLAEPNNIARPNKNKSQAQGETDETVLCQYVETAIEQAIPTSR